MDSDIPITTLAQVFKQRLSEICSYGDLSYVLYMRQHLGVPPPEYHSLIRTALEIAVANEDSPAGADGELFAAIGGADADAGSEDLSPCSPVLGENLGEPYCCLILA